MNITLAATVTSPVSTPVLMAVKEVATAEEGVQWANEQAWRWIRNMQAIASNRGSFRLDGMPANFLNDVDPNLDVPRPIFGWLGNELLLTANDGEEQFVIGVDEASAEALSNAKRLVESAEAILAAPVTLELSAEEATALRVKLSILMTEANGVDIWLNSDGSDNKECFLDCDEEAHFRLGNILEKLGVHFHPHRTSNFKG
jgi:hypothetical protein